MLDTRHPPRSVAPLSAGLFSLLLNAAAAQVPAAELDALFPPGARAGETVTVQPHGNHLDELAGVVVSHPEIEAEIVEGQVHLAIPSTLTPQIVDVAVHGRFGLSNPRAFVIGALPESRESGDHGRPEQAQSLQMGSTLNGTADGTTVDWFTLTPEGTEPLFIDVSAERIDSRMDPTLVILDAHGHELARYQDVRGRDVTATFSPPGAGEPLFLGVHDFLYEGGSSHFYRLTVARQPPPLSSIPRTLADLPILALSPAAAAYEDGTVVRALPASFEGTVAQGDRSGVDLILEESGPVIAEIFSERRGDPSDFRLEAELLDDEGKVTKSLSQTDDLADPVGNKRFQLGSRDPLVTFQAETGKRYRLSYHNQFPTGGAYRLELRRPQPDVHLIAAVERPRELGNQLTRQIPVLRRGGTLHWEILALRRDGHSGPVTVRAENLPEGVSSPVLTLFPGEHSGSLLVTAADDAVAFAGPITITGTFEAEGKPHQRRALGASLLWSVGDFNRERWESRLTRSPWLAVLEQETEPIVLVPAETEIQTCLAAKVDLPFTVKRAASQAGNFKIVLEGLPGLAKPPEATFDPAAEEVKLSLDLASVDRKRLTAGTHVVHVRAWEGKVKYRANPEAAERAEAERQAREEDAKECVTQLEALKESGASPEELAEAEKKLNDANQARDAAAQAAEEAKKRAAEQELNHAFVSQPMVLHIAEGPLRFESLPVLALKSGTETDHTLKFERLHGFEGPVELKLSPPENAALFEVASASVPGESREVVLKTMPTSSPDVPAGTYDATLEIKLNFNGQDLTWTRPIPITFTTAPQNAS